MNASDYVYKCDIDPVLFDELFLCYTDQAEYHSAQGWCPINGCPPLLQKEQHFKDFRLPKGLTLPVLTPPKWPNPDPSNQVAVAYWNKPMRETLGCTYGPVCQKCGKAVGSYPWHDKNPNGDAHCDDCSRVKLFDGAFRWSVQKELSEDYEWIMTPSGAHVWPYEPRGSILVSDIIMMLGNKRRFSGACNVTVLQHCMHVAALCGPSGFWHDAAEAYLPDIARPLRDAVTVHGEPFADVEERLLQYICSALGIELPIGYAEADDRALRVEAVLFMPSWGLVATEEELAFGRRFYAHA